MPKVSRRVPRKITLAPCALYAHAEKKPQALEWLEKTFQEREPALVHLAVAWDWHMLHSEPRFEDLLRKMNLELS